MRLVRMLGAHGIDPAGLCRRAGVSLEEVSNPHARIPYAHADALLDACVAARGVASFALDLARFADPETYDAAGLVLMSSATFGAGLARALTYQRLWADGARFTLTGEVLRFAHPGPSHTARAILAEVAFVETMLAARGLITPSANALTARFSHAAASGDPNELARALGVTPTFGAPHNELVLGRELLTAPVRVPDGAIASVFDRRQLVERAAA